jgi:hypothetical protein
MKQQRNAPKPKRFDRVYEKVEGLTACSDLEQMKYCSYFVRKEVR